MSETKSPAAAQNEAPPPLKGLSLGMTAVMIALAGFMVTLDQAVCNVAIPTMAAAAACQPSVTA